MQSGRFQPNVISWFHNFLQKFDQIFWRQINRVGPPITFTNLINISLERRFEPSDMFDHMVSTIFA